MISIFNVDIWKHTEMNLLYREMNLPYLLPVQLIRDGSVKCQRDGNRQCQIHRTKYQSWCHRVDNKLRKGQADSKLSKIVY